MRTRIALVVLLVVGIGGLIWWLREPAPAPGHSESNGTSANAAAPKPATLPAPATAPTPASERAIVAPPEVIAPPVATPPAARAVSMPGLHFVAEPANGAELAATRGRTLAARGRGMFSDVKDPDSIQTKPPLAAYSIGVNAIADGGGLESVTFNDSYFYMLVADGAAIGSADVRTDETGTTRVVRIGTGGNTPAVLEALNKLATLDQINAGSYEPRILLLPGVYGSGTSSALWLKSDAPGGDLIYALPERFLPKALEGGKIYPAAEFFRLLQPQAQKQVDLYKRYQAGNPRTGG